MEEVELVLNNIYEFTYVRNDVISDQQHVPRVSPC